MRLIGFMQNKNGKVVEYLPLSQQMKNIAQRRELFFSMYNHYVEEDMRFSKSEYQGDSDIKHIFTKKIETLIQELNLGKTSYTDEASRKIISAYHDKCSIITKQRPKLLVAKLINFIYKQGTCSLLLDLDDMFLNLVYERIKKVNKSCDIVMGENEIIMYHKDTDASPTLVIPIYKTINYENLKEDSTVSHNISIAREYLKTDKTRQIFLIFPKSDGFTKHIDLKFDDNIHLLEEEYRVKMIPYSFSFCIKNQKKQRSVKKWQ